MTIQDESVLAFQLFEKKEYEASKNIYEKLLAEDLSAESEIQLRFGYGYVLSELGLVEEALANYKWMGELGAATSNLEIMSQSVHQIGMVYRQAERYEEALIYFEKEQKFIQQHFEKNLLFIAANLYELGYTHLLLSHNDHACSLLTESLHAAKEAEDPVMIACAQRGLGEYFINRQKPRAAHASLKQSVTYFQEAQDEIGVAEVEEMIKQLKI